ncbi:hypothetical protein BTVI_71849 [Pitangus sulphuratus]|nr:hypothetical protein BTVI_71849 [Pitangus sulphuratus]
MKELHHVHENVREALTFDMVSHNILLSKLEGDGFDEWTVRRTRNWLESRIQREVVNGSESKGIDDK